MSVEDLQREAHEFERKFEEALSPAAREFWQRQCVDAEPTEHAPELTDEEKALWAEIRAAMEAAKR